MQLIEIGLVISAFVAGVAIPLFPDPSIREGSQKAIWTLAVAMGLYILFLSICAIAPNFMMLVVSSLASAGAGVLCGYFTVREEGAAKAQAAATVQTAKQHAS